MSKVASLGCLICQRPANVHHIRPIGLGIEIDRATTKRYLYATTIIKANLVFIIANKNLKMLMVLKNNYYKKHLEEIEKLEKANDLFNFYAKER